jgi:hypothetical protein
MTRATKHTLSFWAKFNYLVQGYKYLAICLILGFTCLILAISGLLLRSMQWRTLVEAKRGHGPPPNSITIYIILFIIYHFLPCKMQNNLN